MQTTLNSSPQLASVPWIERLIAFDTVSRNSNLGLIETVRDHLAQQGFKPTLTYDASGAKANLFATLPAADGRETGGIVLSGHTDVVPVDGQDWASDPFRAEVRDGKLYGRGSADMKGFIAAAIALTPLMTASPLRAPIHFALSFDEELGCIGAPLLIDEIVARGVAPDGCIVGEPTGMKVVTAHKGAGCYRCRVVGKPAHASLPSLGVNAIAYAAKLIGLVEERAERFRCDGPFDDAFDTPYSTAQVGLIHGGAAANIVPELCEFVIDHRILPGTNENAVLDDVQHYARETLLPRMRETFPEADIQFERIAGFPPLQPDEDAEITRLARALTGDSDVHKVAFGAEAGLFQQAGVPSVICGPGHIAQAHRADEYVALDQIAACETFLTRLIEEMRAQ